MGIEQQNAAYIKQLNDNIEILDKNVKTLQEGLNNLSEVVKNSVRDSAAMQRAIIEYLRIKEVIKNDEDVKLLQKLHLRQISAIDQELEAQRQKNKNL